MIWINVWNRVLCRFVRTLVSTSAAKAMPHIIIGAILTCGPVTAQPPPLLPPILPSPFMQVPPMPIPSEPVQYVPQPDIARWTFIPPADMPGSLASVFLPSALANEGLQGIHRNRFYQHFDSLRTGPAPTFICDIPPNVADTPVDAPGPLCWFITACVLLFLWHAMALQASAPLSDEQ